MWIRPMLLSDVEAIRRLESDIFSDAWSENNIKDYRVLAYIVFRVNEDEAELFRIATDMQYRGLGCGHKLMNFMISNLRDMKVKKVFLEVRCKNEDAISLYEHYGFKKIGIRKEYYSDPTDDALLMEGYIKC
ncbi:MAG: ribosomal protein S18-alanine N-acetyltransferase [Lachnoanaerobaculum sp.]|nr:ribosomal protein S18-alanine N-acetyltransferase [Lachnoanaerobaculum sp.]